MSDLAYADDQDEEAAEQAQPDRLQQFAQASGDISDLLTDAELSALGMKVAEDWNRDKAANQDWRDAAEKALNQATQDDGDEKTFPWKNASDVDYPLLTIASNQFSDRAGPAIVKGDEAVGVKVLGDTPEPPQMPQLPPGQPPPPELQQALAGYQQAQAAYQAKKARANRVKTWMNYHLFYGLDDWESGVDVLLIQLPIVGMAFKKVYFDPHRGVCSDYVSALHLTVPPDAPSLQRSPRVTQDFELYPYEITSRMASGTYREAELMADGDDDQEARCILEQHRLEDLDGDGVAEPYIITVDEKSNSVLRIEAAFGEDDIARSKKDDRVTHVRRWMPFIPFPFLPDPKGKFYALGFGQLLEPITAVINTAINQLNDAATAAAAGGGFIGSGLRLQGAGQTTNLRFQPGEFKFVTGSGQDIRAAVWERTIPQPSPTTFQVLELMLGAGEKVASVRDVLSGDTPTTAPVGTTLALIEQGLQSFSAIYKRVYRSMKAEFKAIYECEAKWGSAQEYLEILDDPEANFEADFSPKGADIVPVSDPSVVTRAQALAKGQVIQQVAVAFPGAINPQEAAKRIFEAAQIENPDALIVQPPQGPPPEMIAEIKKKGAEADQAAAHAEVYRADAAVKTGQAHQEGAELAAFALGAAHEGGIPSVAGEPGQPMGGPGPPGGVGQPQAGVGGIDLGPQPGGGDPSQPLQPPAGP